VSVCVLLCVCACVCVRVCVCDCVCCRQVIKKTRVLEKDVLPSAERCEKSLGFVDRCVGVS